MIGMKITNGDLVITNNEIELVEGNELKRQTIQSVLSTNKGEWLFDTEEGIEFDNVLDRSAENVARAEIESGVEQVDNTLSVGEFTLKDDPDKRIRSVHLKATAQNGETVEVTNVWA